MHILLFVIAGIIMGGVIIVIKAVELNLLSAAFTVCVSIILLNLMIITLAGGIKEISYPLLFYSFSTSGFISATTINEIFLRDDKGGS